MSRSARIASISRVGHDGRGAQLAEVADRMVRQIEDLVSELATLRAENGVLRTEVREAVSMMERVSSSLAGRRPGPAKVGGRPASGNGRRAGRGRARGRATPAGVTVDVVKAVLAKLGEATAAEVAAEITRAGAPVSGRAVRFLAERAGAQTSVGQDGQRRYRLG
ncbi:MAG: hypothetical protein E6J14_08445 [Chloroflexi bacterium]|nr:MAG: hypothetical protein E6J14_08445 [Chloroflexota bacterium]